MSAAILDNLRAYKVELEELQTEYQRDNGDGSPCVEMSLAALQRAIDNAAALLATAQEAVPLLSSVHPALAERLSAQLQIAQSEVVA